MKMISNFKNENELDVQLTISESNYNTSYENSLNNDRGEVVTREQLVSCINTQFEMLYKVSHQRKYLVKEVSSYFIQR